LLGIVAPKYATGADVPSHGVALIAIDGKMPKAYVVGSRVDGDMTLKSVSLRTVSIGGVKDAPAITLELPLPAAPATGTLTMTTGGTPAYVPPMPAPPSFVPPSFVPPPQTIAPLNMPPPATQNVPLATPRETDPPK
jgi:general secretion pathway protein C